MAFPRPEDDLSELIQSKAGAGLGLDSQRALDALAARGWRALVVIDPQGEWWHAEVWGGEVLLAASSARRSIDAIRDVAEATGT